MSIFLDMVEIYIKIFMDDFSFFGNSFNNCLSNLTFMLQICKRINLVLNWDKCHFMIEEGKVSGHKISSKGIKVDRAKIDLITKLPPPSNVKGIRSFLGHTRFYWRFIKDFSLISKYLCELLVKEVPFQFDKKCLHTFQTLKNWLQPLS